MMFVPNYLPWILIFSLVIGARGCPRTCKCDGTVVLCSGHYPGIPTTLPLDMTELSLVQSDITRLVRDSFARYTKLEKLVIQRTTLNTIHEHAFRGMESIERIYINLNLNLKNLQSGAFAYLNNSRPKRIYLQKNRIQSLEPYLFKHSSKIRMIDLRQNPVREIRSHAFSHVYYLDFLNLPENLVRIQPDSFNDLVRVHQIWIQWWTTRETLPYTFQGLSRLKYLRIEASDLGVVRPATFAHMETVEIIYIYNSEIKYLEAPSFSNIRNIRLVLIKNSYLAQLDLSLRPLIQQRLVSLNNSRIACTCGNLWLLSKDSGMTVKALKQITCFDGHWHEKSAWDVRYEFLNNCRTPRRPGTEKRSVTSRLANQDLEHFRFPSQEEDNDNHNGVQMGSMSGYSGVAAKSGHNLYMVVFVVLCLRVPILPTVN